MIEFYQIDIRLSDYWYKSYSDTEPSNTNNLISNTISLNRKPWPDSNRTNIQTSGVTIATKSDYPKPGAEFKAYRRIKYYTGGLLICSNSY